MIVASWISAAYQYIIHSKFYVTVMTSPLLSFFDDRPDSSTYRGIREIYSCRPSQRMSSNITGSSN